MCVYIHTYMHKHTYKVAEIQEIAPHTHTHTHSLTHSLNHSLTHTHSRTHARTHTHAHMHTQTCTEHGCDGTPTVRRWMGMVWKHVCARRWELSCSTYSGGYTPRCIRCVCVCVRAYVSLSLSLALSLSRARARALSLCILPCLYLMCVCVCALLRTEGQCHILQFDRLIKTRKYTMTQHP